MDTELRALVDVGDLRAAGALLVERHAHEVFGLVRAMVRDATTAEDLVQDVFGSAFTALGSWRGEASSRTWLLTIARNRCIDHLRAQKRAPFAGGDGDVDAHADEAPLVGDLLARRAEVEGALAELDEGDRALVILRFRHGMSYEELATVFGLKEGTVRMRMSRALSRMRRALDQTPVEAAAVWDRAALERQEAPVAKGIAGPNEAVLDELADDESMPEDDRSAARAPVPLGAPPGAMPPARSAPPPPPQLPGAPPAPAGSAARPPPSQAAAPRARSGVLGTVVRAFSGGRSRSEERSEEAAPDALAAFLATVDPGVPSALRSSLLARASHIETPR